MNVVASLIEFFIILVSHVAAGIYSSNLKYSKRTTFFIWGIWIVVQSGILFCSEFLTENIAIKFFMGFVLAFLGQYFIFFATTKGRLSQRVFTMLTYSVFFCIIATLFTVFRGSFPNAPMLLRIAVYIGLIFVIDYYFLRFICPLCKKASKSIKTGWYKLIFSSVIFMITIIVSSVFPVKLTSFADSGFVTFLFLSIAIFAAYPIIFSNIKNMAEAAAKKEMEQQNKLLLLQIEKENLKMAQDRMLRHDRRHHNLVLLNFANNNDTESIKEYLKKLTENDVDNKGGVTYCKNLTINTVLSAYERLAGDEGISVKISADAGFDLPVSPQDLVIVIANLFENAIYATSKIGLRDKIIDIDIRHKESRLFIKIENPCKANLEFDETDYGIGINSVINTVEKYDGMYDFSVEDGIFSSKICLNF